MGEVIDQEPLDKGIEDKPKAGFEMGGDVAQLRFYHLDIDTISSSLDKYLKSRNYKLEKGTPVDGTYGRGNLVLNILFGYFHKRYETYVVIVQSEDYVFVKLKKKGTGIFNGIIGAGDLMHEFKTIANSFNDWRIKVDVPKASE